VDEEILTLALPSSVTHDVRASIPPKGEAKNSARAATSSVTSAGTKTRAQGNKRATHARVSWHYEGAKATAAIPRIYGRSSCLPHCLFYKRQMGKGDRLRWMEWYHKSIEQNSPKVI
jgi:hypothetical protein